MSAPITLPGSIPGLLRLGSPVLVAGDDFPDTPTPGVYLGLDTAPAADRHGDHVVAPVVQWPLSGFDYAWMARSCKSAEIALDLSDPTGRAHAAWWLAERMKCDTSGGASWGQPWGPNVPHWALAGGVNGNGVRWSLAGGVNGNGVRWSLTFAPGVGGVPGLELGLSDAEALRRVVLALHEGSTP